MALEAEYTIDELARVADITVRSVRVYHERGLLPSPEVRGRIGYYDPNHLERLHTISRLLGRGMKLNGIKELLQAWDRGDDLGDVLGVAQRCSTAAPADRTEGTKLREALTHAGMPPEEIDQLMTRLREDCAAVVRHYTAATSRLTTTTHWTQAQRTIIEQLEQGFNTNSWSG